MSDQSPTDIVERLLRRYPTPLEREAAAEIKRLRTALKESIDRLYPPPRPWTPWNTRGM